MDNLKIELAGPSDAAIISLLGRITFSETFGHLFHHKGEDLQQNLHTTFSVDKIKSSLQKPNNIFWLAYVDALPVGYAKLKIASPSTFLDEPNVGQLQKIYVLKDFLAMKIGSNLQDTLLEKAQQLGIKKIWLSVLKANDRAIQFYLKNGFVTLGGHEFEIGQQRFDFQAMGKTF